MAEATGQVLAAGKPNPFLEWVEKYQGKPVEFVKEVLGAVPDEWQEEFLQSIADGHRRITVKSGHGVGKSTAASWAAIWYLLTRHPVKIVITAPTKAQLYDALFAELKTWITRLPPALQDLVDVKSDYVEFVPKPSAAFISVRTSRAETPEAMAGVHSENVMLIGDEASGIPEAVFEAAAGSMSGENAVTLLMGNPVRSSGYFFDTHNRLKSQWKCIHVSCETSKRVSKEWIKEMATRYGERSNAFRVRVLGEFPLSDDDTVIPYELVDTALGRDVVNSPNTPLIWGLDVARFGTDASALIERRGRRLDALPTLFRGLDLMQLSGQVAARYESLDEKRRPTDIFIDSIGIGAGVLDRLKELGLPVRGVNVSDSPAVSGTYQNLRAELWYRVRAWLAGRDVALPAKAGLQGHELEALERLIEDLSSTKYQFAERTGKIQIESKKEMRKRTGRSPDAGDALMLTFAGSAIGALHGRAGSNHRRPIRRNLKGIV